MTLAANQIVKRPLITEKSTWEGTSRNRYSFLIALSATKPQVRKAVEELYGVRVASVATQRRKGAYFRTKWGEARKPEWKKAVVELHPEDRIELF